MYGVTIEEQSVLTMPRSRLWKWFAFTLAVTEAVTFWFAPAEWGMIRTFFAGLFMGAWSFYCIFINWIMMS